uniref:AAA+ ATPase domain-containing protein n=1 Tax=Salix viminalis TaxID=40686 RepID=A0A6N2MHN2_SALVM
MASTVVELLFHPITRSVTRVFYYSRNVKSLETHMEELSDKKTRVLHSVEEATNKTEEIEDDVVEWLASVDAITEEADRVLKDKDKAKKRCFMGLFPNLMTRYRVSIEIKSIDEEAGNISLNGDKFDRVSYLPARRGIGDRSVKDYEAFESRRHVLNEILEALKDNDVNLVGVYGMPGVGKTTIVKKVAEQVKANRIFDVVVLAVVSKTPDLRRIQGEIADGLGFELKAETDRGRAERLRERLERETKVLERETKVLVILDDIWERLELDDVGIPSGSDNRGCKILMTSRDRNALYRGMDTKKLFHLQVLLENEAWNLFENKAGDPIKKPDLQLVAVEVAKRCAGLPILLVTVASALKDGDLSEWKDALERLKRFDKDEIDSRVYSALELSYTSLKGEEIKSVFLLCGQLIPHIIRIHDLLKYTVGLGLFKGISTLEEARHRLNKLVNDLIACCLLEGGADGIVKMHDVLHAFAASVASRDHHVFTSSSGTVLREWPAKNMLEQYSAISLPACKIPGLPEVLNCPKLESFILYNEDPSLKIPDCLFKGTKTLQLMDMTDVQLPTLPSSFQFLEKLQTLCLNSCGLEDIALIGELKMLKVLSLIGSNIVRLPREIGKLTRLQLLDLRDNPTLEIIPPNVLSCLTQLEDLYMENSFLQWGVEGLDSLRNNASLAELKNLPYLSTLYLHITDPMILPKDFFSKKLERFNILIGEGWEWSSKRETSTIMKLKISASIQSEEGIQLLLKRTEDLHLDGLEGVKSVSYELDGQGFPSLKHLHIQNSLEIRYIVDSTMLSPIVAFPFLVSLSLDNLNKLEKICNGQPVAESFSKLRILKVKRCPMLKNLFSLHMERGLLQLEEIVAEESGGEADEDEAIKLTQLRTLTLKYLPQFTSVSSKSNAASISQTRPEPTNLENCPVFVRLTSLIVEGCRNLKYLFTTSMVESLAQLKRLELCDCVSMEEIIIKNGLGEEENVRGVMLPKLQFLKLKGLPNLTRFCTACICVFGFQAIPNLEELSLDVKDAAKVCQGQFSADLFHKVRVLALRCFDDASAEFPFGILHGFQNMEKLVVNGGCYKELFPCQLVDEEEHTLDRIRCLELGYLSDLEKIWNQDLRVDQLLQNLETLEVRFCDSLINLAPSASSFGNLTALHVEDCKALKYLVTSSTARSLVQLSVMSIRECKMVTEIVASNGDEAGNEIIFRKLESLKLDCLASLTSFCSVDFTFRFPRLTEVIVTNCPKMKTFSLGILSTPKLRKDQPGELSYGFVRLTSLIVEGCRNLKYLFTTSMVESLAQLKRLELCDCVSMEEIIIKNGLGEEANARGTMLPKLEALKLKGLPNLTRFCTGHPQLGKTIATADLFHKDEAIKLTHLRTLTLEYLPQPTSVSSKSNAASISQTRPEPLTSLIVEGCRNLKYLFTTSMVESLAQLKRLDICDCVSMEEIIIKNGLGEEENVIPNLEELSLDVKDAAKVCQGQFSADLFHKVRVLALQSLDDAATEFPFGILHRFQNMEKLVVTSGYLKELVPCQLVDEEEHTLARIRCLELAELPYLEKIWNQDLRVDQLLQNLETLEVRYCDSLINLAPSASTFGNLTALHVRGCKALKYLVTSSTARSLVQLSVMSIRECEMVTEIVASNGDEAGNEIIFWKLESLKLGSLASLTSFCSVNFTFRFPCLTEVIVTNCPKMKTFSLGILSTPKLQKKKRTKYNGKATLTSPFNSCIYKLDCIGSAFNVKGAMQCPNCRKIEKGQWLYANGCRSLPEFSMEDWAHDEDLYDLSYSEMSFGVHWCPFGSLTRLPSSFEEGEFSSNGCKRFSILFE